MQSVKASDRQSLFDVCIASLGSIDRVLEVAFINGIEITDELKSGQVVMIPDVAFAQKDAVAYLNNEVRPWKVASGDAEIPEAIVPNISGGIGFMRIQGNFKVN